MLESMPAAFLVGILLGYLAGLGVGGGSLLILWLTIVLNTEPITARAINLMFFIAAAGTVSLFRIKQGSLQLSKILPGIIAGCCAAALGSFAAMYLDTKYLKKLFGVLLLATGIKELLYRPRKFK